MSCEICGRSSCTRSFHSIEAQERHDEKQEMSDDVDELRELVLTLKEEVKKLEKTINDYDFY